VGSGNDVEVGAAGDSIFAGTIQALLDLKTALENNQVDGIRAAIDDLGQEFNLISENISETGAKIKRMEVKVGILKDMKITGTERLSKLEDADIAEAITDLKAKELAYKAALASSAKIMRLSLVDYL
jgi:flagellar hook-associated protein 3 FlgL